MLILLMIFIFVFGILCGVVIMGICMGRRVGELTVDREELNQYREQLRKNEELHSPS